MRLSTFTFGLLAFAAGSVVAAPIPSNAAVRGFFEDLEDLFDGKTFDSALGATSKRDTVLSMAAKRGFFEDLFDGELFDSALGATSKRGVDSDLPSKRGFFEDLFDGELFDSSLGATSK